MRQSVQRVPDDLGARLRALRQRYPTLAINTEIIHHTDRLITFRATIAIEALVRAQGHAAQPAEPTGAFVTAAETMAVEQALLLGGFDIADDSGPVTATPGQETLAVPQAPPPAVGVAVDQSSQAGERENPETFAAEPGPGELAEAAAAVDVRAAPSAPDTSPDDAASTAAVIAVPAGTESTPPVPPRPKRDRQAERARAKARAASATLPSETADESVGADAPPFPDETSSADTLAEMAEPTPAPTATVAAAPTTNEAIDIHPVPLPPAPAESASATSSAPVTPTPPATPRRSRTRPAAAAPPATATPDLPTPDAPPTREALRETWRVGRPIPVWWPQNRPVVTQPIGKARVGRLRALALDEEISPSLLDTYSTLLFGVAVAALDQAQSLILEERLNPAYPSPLEELRVRRIIHPLAVGDAMTIPEDRPFFIRWRDVPPVEETMAEAPEPSAPPTLSWRERGKKGSGRRR